MQRAAVQGAWCETAYPEVQVVRRLEMKHRATCTLEAALSCILHMQPAILIMSQIGVPGEGTRPTGSGFVGV